MTAICTTDRRQCDSRRGLMEFVEVEFVPFDWLSRAAWWPGLIVHSRPVKVPAYADCRRQAVRRSSDLEALSRQASGDFFVESTPVDVIERLLKEALLPVSPDSFQSVDLEVPD